MESLITMLIWEIVEWTGFVISIPVLILNKLTKFPAIRRKDVFDKWTLGHMLAGYIIADFSLAHYSKNPVTAFGISLLIMGGLWEFIMDGLRWSDPEGYSLSDIGADTVGAILALLINL